jgi:hypothetical protein
VSVSTERLLEVIHCIDTCGPDGGLVECGECDACEVRAALATPPAPTEDATLDAEQRFRDALWAQDVQVALVDILNAKEATGLTIVPKVTRVSAPTEDADYHHVHDFDMHCRSCGEPGTLFVAFITPGEQVEVHEAAHTGSDAPPPHPLAVPDGD